MADEGTPQGGRGLTRKQALIGAAGVAVAGGGAAAVILASGDENGGGEADGYPRRRVARMADLQPNQPVTFEYPGKGQQSVLIDLGQGVPGGIGDNGSVVAYSSLCQHMGCPVAYQAQEKHFHCGCHQTRYDPAREGAVIQGVAQRPLPRIALEVDGEDIVATGVSGLIYGFRRNVAGMTTA